MFNVCLLERFVYPLLPLGPLYAPIGPLARQALALFMLATASWLQGLPGPAVALETFYMDRRCVCVPHA